MCFDFFNASIRVRSHESDHDELLDRLVLWPTLWSHNETNCAKQQILQAPVTVVSISVEGRMGAANLVLPRVANMKRVPDCPWPAGARASNVTSLFLIFCAGK